MALIADDQNGVGVVAPGTVAPEPRPPYPPGYQQADEAHRKGDEDIAARQLKFG